MANKDEKPLGEVTSHALKEVLLIIAKYEQKLEILR